ncbi:MAG: hypothetical protein QF719_03560 [Chloroflexota bacterium]|jgi:predicted regulator of Ras-like GTPase activity (Roadblock/LC7/MglB family)|nr:hypothetical protein [Chloroflexota bacterium]MDP6507538.1 hypothetical protein [Chloroflexota bacterium]MDP6757274.1 hypothetical protein [Chloroflexota bacterium]
MSEREASLDELINTLLGVDAVRGAVVWRLGELPRSRWADDYGDAMIAPLLAALTGSLEKGIEDLNLGHLSQIWWQTDRIQCVGFRAGSWEVLVFAAPDANIGGLRTGVARILDDKWHLLESEEE